MIKAVEGIYRVYTADSHEAVDGPDDGVGSNRYCGSRAGSGSSRYEVVDRVTYLRDFGVVYQMIVDGPL